MGEKIEKVSQRKIGMVVRFLATCYGVAGCVFSCVFILNLFEFEFDYSLLHVGSLMVSVITSFYCLAVGVLGRMKWFSKE